MIKPFPDQPDADDLWMNLNELEPKRITPVQAKELPYYVHPVPPRRVLPKRRTRKALRAKRKRSRRK